MLAEEWSTLQLGELSRKPITYGIVQTGEPVEGGVRCVRVVDITKSQINPEEFITTSHEISQSYQRTLLEEDDVILALRGEIGCCVRVTSKLVGCNLTRGVARIAPKLSVVVPSFLTQVLRSPYMQRVFDQKKNGSALQEISIGELRKLLIPLPSLDEQHRISGILLTWDRAIELTEKLIAAKQMRKAALEQTLFAGKVRLPGFTDGWETRNAGSLFKAVSVKNHPGERVLSVTQDMGVVYRNEMDRKIGMSQENTGGYKLVVPGDFIISLRSFQGGLELSRVRGLVSPAYHVIRAAAELDTDFFRHFFKSYEFIERLGVAIIGIRDGKQISYEDFSALQFRVPPVREQVAIAVVLNTQDREIELLQKKLDALRRQKKGLMQQLLTGKVRVNVTGASGE